MLCRGCIDCSSVNKFGALVPAKKAYTYKSGGLPDLKEHCALYLACQQALSMFSKVIRDLHQQTIASVSGCLQMADPPILTTDSLTAMQYRMPQSQLAASASLTQHTHAEHEQQQLAAEPHRDGRKAAAESPALKGDIWDPPKGVGVGPGWTMSSVVRH